MSGSIESRSFFTKAYLNARKHGRVPIQVAFGILLLLPTSRWLLSNKNTEEEEEKHSQKSCHKNNALENEIHISPTALVPGKLGRFVLERVCSLKEYAPCWWMGPHFQTFWTATYRKPPSPAITYQRQWVTTDNDGARVALDWHLPPQPTKPTLILLHGLVGGSQETYIKWMVYRAASLGITPVVMNARGCANSRLETPQTFSAAFTGDVRAVVSHLKSSLGTDTPLFCVGFSLGAGVLAKYLAEEGEQESAPFTAAACLSGSFNYMMSSQRLEHWFARHSYNSKLASNLGQFLKQHEYIASQAPWLDLRKAYAARSIREFDEAVIVPMYGYKDTDEYYKDASTYDRLKYVRVPTLLINAKDDPVCAVEGLPVDVVLENENLIAVRTQQGGHVAWATGKMPQSESWAERPVCEFFLTVLEYSQSQNQETYTT